LEGRAKTRARLRAAACVAGIRVWAGALRSSCCGCGGRWETVGFVGDAESKDVVDVFGERRRDGGEAGRGTAVVLQREPAPVLALAVLGELES